MRSIKVLIAENAAVTRDYLTELVQIMGYQAHAIKEKTQFVKAFHHYNPDLLLLGSSHHEGHVRAFAQIVEREKSGTPILFLQDGSPTLEEVNFPETANISRLPRHFDSAALKQAIEKLVQASRGPDHKYVDRTIIGQAPAMKKIKRHIAALSKSDVTVLISGESGTGKELAAQAIHRLSPRANKPFVKVNSAALPTNLLESELFGFEKGAFTGAFQKKPGKFALAHSGTIFLDEISELPLPMQAKVLQVLQDSEVSSLGSVTNTRFDTRVITATNANLSKLVREGQFRSDLYFRVNVVSIHMPPLRERKEDIDALCHHFLKEYAAAYGNDLGPITKETRERFYQYHWPGNVRELRNFIQGMAVLGDEEGFFENMANNGRASFFVRGKGALPSEQAGASGTAGSSSGNRRPLKEVCKEAARRAETEAIMDALFHTNWNRKEAAALLKVSYKALLNKVKEYGIETQYGERNRKD
jgi:two-component system response regulator AtoC